MSAVSLLTSGCGTPTPPPRAEDRKPEPPRPPSSTDRPPVVVSDGSIDMYIDWGPNGRGEWKDRGSAKWFHDYQGPPTDHFDVYLQNTKKDLTRPNCMNPDHPFVVTDMTIKYGLGPVAKIFKIYVDGGNLEAQLPAGTQGKLEAKTWLRFGLPGQNLHSVDFGPEGACEFGGGPRSIITIRQRQK